MRLSDAQIRALEAANGELYEQCQIKFRTGESLRRLGLLDRYTETVAHGVYVSRDYETVQPWTMQERHEWYITAAGKAALRGAA